MVSFNAPEHFGHNSWRSFARVKFLIIACHSWPEKHFKKNFLEEWVVKSSGFWRCYFLSANKLES
jgi:hypothetical protein